ncbi:MAG: UDP-N-acetylglucosamine 1-carboxyvinyltransferase [Planctomycetales bacterium]|nr:UDP-N-acetylglucosamine 1-carboxyvinyltransferase [Planctomycetales bacterium]
MDRFIIEGGVRLRGKVSVSGAKNAALPILAATLLADGPCTLQDVPDLYDVRTMIGLLGELGVEAKRRKDGALVTRVVDASPVTASYERVRAMRASICVLGPLVARRGRAKVSMPGGCSIGVRPIDLHLKGLKALGARIPMEAGYVEAEAPRLRGAEIYLGGTAGSTVTGTANVVMAATLAEGRTVIENAACEPEVADLCDFLRAMGAKVKGGGTPRIEIQGVASLHGARHRVIPDRIEAGTFLVAGAITRGEVEVTGARAEHLGAVRDFLQATGAELAVRDGSIAVRASNRPRAVDVATLPYPGFPTDLQAQAMALLAVAEGISVVSERIYPDRFQHVAELNRMGANIRKEGPSAVIQGVLDLSGAPVQATDLRASAGLLLAGLVARGATEVNRVDHIDRGYERIEERLAALGARIVRKPYAGSRASDRG